MRGTSLALALAACASSALASPAHETQRQRARDLTELLRGEICASALESGQRFFASRDFALLPLPEREGFAAALARCALEAGETELAAKAARRAGGEAAELAARLELARALPEISRALDERRFTDAADAFVRLAETSPETARRIDEDRLWWLYREIDQRRDGKRFLALHDAIVSAELEFALDSTRFEHARLLLDAGQPDRAKERLAGRLYASDVVAIRADRRFDPLREDPAFEARLDVRRAAEASLARARGEAASDPTELEHVVAVMSELRSLGRSAEAVREGEQARTLDSASGGLHYSDRDEQLNWLHNELAYALYEVGRTHEARAAFEAGVAHGENGRANVSQAINFALALTAEGEPARALAVLERLGEMSVYGEMWAAAARACAHEQRGALAKRDEALGFLLQNEERNPRALIRGLVCADDRDALVSLFTRRLERPDARAEMLGALQRYRVTEAVPPPALAKLRDTLHHVRNDRNVAAAIDAVGRIEDVPLAASVFAD